MGCVDAAGAYVAECENSVELWLCKVRCPTGASHLLSFQYVARDFLKKFPAAGLT